MADQEYNENDPEVKDSRSLFDKLFDYLVYEISMRKRIVGETNQICLHPGTYYYEQDPSQTKYMMSGNLFPPVHIRPRKGEHGGGSISPGVWVLKKEESPRKSWRDLGHVYLLIVIFALAILLIRFASTVPLF